MKYLIGMGNYSMGDDGIGLRITEHISDNMLDDGFEAIEVANNGMQLLTYFDDNTEKLLIVDAVKFGGKPGEHILFSPEDVKTQKVVGTVSTHEGDILKLITMAEELELTAIEFSEDNRTRFLGSPLDHIYVRGLSATSSDSSVVTSSDHNPLTVTLGM